MKELIEDLHKFRILNRLKSIYRKNSVDNRKESSAEHSWSCLLLADFFLSKIDLGIDKTKVYELLIYHDILEIESGDIPLEPKNNNFVKDKKDEEIFLEKLQKQLPMPLDSKFLNLHNEFKEQKTSEAKFAKLIDSLDPIIHELDYKEDWTGWSKEFFIKEKSKYFEEFPDFIPLFNEILEYLTKNNYFAKKKEYLVKKGEDKNLPENENGDFGGLFKRFTEPFMKDFNVDTHIQGTFMKRDNSKAIYIIKNKNQELYGGKLWNDPDVDVISNMDYMYCLPSWDWWINPEFPSESFRVEYLNHTPGKYGNTVVFVNNNKNREEDFKSILSGEGFEILEIKRQYDANNIEFFMFYDYYRIFLPLKMARELKRIKVDLEKSKPNKLYFLLRSGFLLSEFFNYPGIKKEFINPKSFKGDIRGGYIIDDCIVMARSLKKLNLKKDSHFTLSVLDCSMPKRIYEKEYLKAHIRAPIDLINMFSCRIFEKNPFLIGMDFNRGKEVYYNSLVRKTFINEIKRLQKLKNINKIVNSMAIDLFNYREGGYKNKHFEKLISIKNE
ncbi:hypothetical protein COU59_00805 [Candidatus Pacearchaeota archaeon CG10_big_fil_rev_8_21_14_0_10_34_12]|nr:MAG: hypothetical protein COU59_00805 [Candidatus Pacearchaeota archaeon CG10_big_fil_rev_8_21_14_0_10_34_12]